MIKLHKPRLGLQQSKSLTNNAKMILKVLPIDSRKVTRSHTFYHNDATLSVCSVDLGGVHNWALRI